MSQRQGSKSVLEGMIDSIFPEILFMEITWRVIPYAMLFPFCWYIPDFLNIPFLFLCGKLGEDFLNTLV